MSPEVAVAVLRQMLVDELRMGDRFARTLELDDAALIKEDFYRDPILYPDAAACRANAESCVRTAGARVSALQAAIAALESERP